MKDKLIIAIKLFIIAALSGLALFYINRITDPVIKDNRIKREEEKYEVIFPGYDSYEKVEDDITQIALYDSEKTLMGYIYSASMNNDYGSITLLVGISEADEIVKVEYALLNQTPSYASKVENDDFLGLFTLTTTSDFEDVDVKVGATYSAATTRDLVIMISDYHEEVK